MEWSMAWYCMRRGQFALNCRIGHVSARLLARGSAIYRADFRRIFDFVSFSSNNRLLAFTGNERIEDTYVQTRSGMSVGSGGRTPFKRTTQNTLSITKKSSGKQTKAAEPTAAPARSAPIAGRKRDTTVASLFSARRPAASKKVEERTIVRGDKATKPASQRLKGQPSQQSAQQQQQSAPLRQASSASSLEAKSDVPSTGNNWAGSLGGKEPARSKATSTTSKSTAKACRMQEMEREIEALRKDRARLEASLHDAVSEAQNLRELHSELVSLKEQHSLELERLTEENEALRARLRDVAHSPLSDSEKQQLLLDASRLHNSAPASIAIPQDDGSANNTSIPQEGAQCTTPDWDKHSSSSMSEVSVACLQDRILQMEETHYSTNEELQATIQELSDLQTHVAELQADNVRLNEEKAVLLESLCRQTEKLEDSRSKVDTLQELLLRDEQPQEASKGYNTEREQKLVDLLKSAQEEREALLLKLEELTKELKNIKAIADTRATEIERLTKSLELLETSVDTASVERKQLDIELMEARQEGANRGIEISRLGTLLENARAKIEELEQSRQLENKSEADELLDAARREKDTLETQAAALQEQLARSHCDQDRLRDQYLQLQEEYKVARNNAKSAIDDLEYRLNQMKDEWLSVSTELQLVRDSLVELQTQCQRHLEDKRELKAALSEEQRREREARTRQYELERALTDERKLRQEENAEWEQFQTDLLMTVRVANDFKTEAQSELERVVMENKAQRDKLRSLEAQLDKLNKANQKVIQQPPPRPASTPTETQQSVLTSVQQEIAARRKANISRQDSRLSVKCLIESIENATKQAKVGPGSRSSSTSSLNSIGTTDIISLKAPLRDQQQINNLICTANSTNNNKTQSTIAKKPVSETKSTPVVLNPGELLDSAALNAKAIDFVRRNSVTDLSERKDPLYGLVKNGGSKRNALLKWCQNKTIGYRNIDITNFSSSWNDGLALCAILHSYLPRKVPYDTLTPVEKRRNFSIAFSAAESVGIPTTLNIGEMCQLERPDWQQVMMYVTSIYKHFET
ncbi:cytospin-A isoform X9 [Anoplolepis gracilipes]|uniref:cytospin-A isoform X9 n=1 Tax=Anoplolepis gracilipes TaxID=354296 RepID=UPI003BA334FB